MKSSLALALLVLLSGCANGPVTEVEPCVEIPFIDAPEGACTNTVTQKAYLVSAADWKKERPTMIMLRARDWTKIKKDWLKACRIAGPNCNVQVQTVDDAIRKLDQIVGEIYKP